MKDNKDYTKINTIKLNTTRLLFIGFIVGIIPFMLLITIISIHEGGLKFIPTVLKNTLVISGLITACINSLSFKKMYYEKIKNGM